MCRSVELTLGNIWLGKKSKKKTRGIHWWSSGEESSLQCGGCEFDPWLGNSDPTCYTATKPRHCTLRATHCIERSLCAAQPEFSKRKKTLKVYLSLNILQSVGNGSVIKHQFERLLHITKNNYKDHVKTWILWKYKMYTVYSYMNYVSVHTHTQREKKWLQLAV